MTAPKIHRWDADLAGGLCNAKCGTWSMSGATIRASQTSGPRAVGTSRGPDPQDAGGPMDERTLERFLAKVEKQNEVTSPHVDTPCWIWTASRYPSGYGVMRIKINGEWKSRAAHRLHFEHHNGAIPGNVPGSRGWLVCHRCDVRHCVNPEHLFLGSNRDNAQDMSRKGRSPRGERGGLAKITRAQAIAIARATAAGETVESIAARHSIGKTAVSDIRRGRTWSHVTRGIRPGPRRPKLTREDAARIREQYRRQPESHRAIAERLGVSRSRISQILRGEY